jgi:hypothetical protein
MSMSIDVYNEPICFRIDRQFLLLYAFMAPASSSAKTPSKKRGKKSSQPLLNYSSVKKTAADGKKTHGKAQNTTANYDGHIRRGREFLAAYQDEQMSRAMGESDSAANTDSDVLMDSEFPHAFSGPPVKCTPFALSTFLGHKCFTENVGASTASQVHAAFLHYYDNM